MYCLRHSRTCARTLAHHNDHLFLRFTNTPSLGTIQLQQSPQNCMFLTITFSEMDDVLALFFQRLLRQRLLWFPQLD